MTVDSTTGIHSLPISQRPPTSWKQKLRALAFFFIFNLGCSMINASQFVFLLPLRLLPFKWSRSLYDEGIRYTKGAFGCLLVLMCQWFSPTSLKITFEANGKGAIPQDVVESILVRDKEDKVVSLNLPSKFVYIANHQIYADWWYAWCFLYYMSSEAHRYIYITLKKSLRWVPVVGWGMQFFDFIFLARSWASDRRQLAVHLSSLGKTAESDQMPLAFILYPEGTLVSKDTRPISKKFADKMGINDMSHVLLPRSTGLLYSLRSLSPRISNLHLIDVTMVYPGIPPLAYGQDYYTLRSMFLDGVAPPAVHMHLRLFKVEEVPIGDLSDTESSKIPDTSPDKHAVEVEIPTAEKEAFDLWLRNLWQEKDESIGRFHRSGRFSEEKLPVFEVPLKLRRTREIFDAFCFFLPATVIGYLWSKLKA
ncbi:acyltransferase-domain-containing protein [Lentinula edodes]|uniref:acyltransferase-domain-containing protein n=1 Tax=Lentinula edodes TaxID=5353 RepID=UPI001E8CCC39|nr:acyltransferase-domain-containing protein [Lentinula edodes]KAH7880506.1 acyltransferase-domain-containing protein [Lentinula edodes]